MYPERILIEIEKNNEYFSIKATHESAHLIVYQASGFPDSFASSWESLLDSMRQRGRYLNAIDHIGVG